MKALAYVIRIIGLTIATLFWCALVAFFTLVGFTLWAEAGSFWALGVNILKGLGIMVGMAVVATLVYCVWDWSTRQINPRRE